MFNWKREQKKWNWTDEFQALSGIFAEEDIHPAKLREQTEANSFKFQHLDLWGAAEMQATQIPGIFFFFVAKWLKVNRNVGEKKMVSL